MCENYVDYCSTIDTEEIQVKHDLPYVSAAVGIVTASDESDFCRVKALEDSGAQIAVISDVVVQQLPDVIPIGTVQLSGILGKPTVCPLVRIQVRLVENLLGDTVSLGSAPKAIVTCAVLEAAAEDLILPIAVIDKLRKMIQL